MTLELVPAPQEDESQESFIEQPGKLMRLAYVARAMLDEARDAPCDAAGCERLRAIYERTLGELSALLSTDLRGELEHLAVTFGDAAPSPSELRVAQAELVGWLEGLFHGIAAAAQDQGAGAKDLAAAIVDAAQPDTGQMPGQYL